MSTENSAQILIDLQRKVNEIAVFMRTPNTPAEALPACDELLGLGVRLRAKLIEERTFWRNEQ